MPRPNRTLVVTLALAALAPLGLGFREASAARAAGGEDAAPALRVLVTNDDGIESAGVAALVAELSAFAEVYVSAPAENCSGSSASSDGFGRPLSLVEHEIEGATRACAVGGKPVDAVQFGVFALGRDEADRPPFDLVVSGVNRGANVGELSHYSGTVGAAVAAAHQGIPAIAVSQEAAIGDYGFAARFTARFARELLRRGARPGVIYSINVPAGSADDVRGVAPARMGGAQYFVDGYVEGTDEAGNANCRARIQRSARAPEGSDTLHYLTRDITITPLRFDWTDREVLAELQGWGLTVE